MIDTDRKTADLLRTLRDLASTYAQEAADLNRLVDAIAQVDDTTKFVGSTIGQNVLDAVVGTFNTSNKVSRANGAVRLAFGLQHGEH